MATFQLHPTAASCFSWLFSSYIPLPPAAPHSYFPATSHRRLLATFSLRSFPAHGTSYWAAAGPQERLSRYVPAALPDRHSSTATLRFTPACSTAYPPSPR